MTIYYIWTIVALAWLIGGYFFARWFVNSFLDDGRWSDTGKEANPFIIHLFSPLFAIMFFLAGVFIVVTYPFQREKVSKFYGGK